MLFAAMTTAALVFVLTFLVLPHPAEARRLARPIDLQEQWARDLDGHG